MPGYFTDRRTIGDPLVVKTVDRFDMSHPHTMIAVNAPAQLTTSFRSRAQTDDEIIADADKIFINGFRSNFGGNKIHGSKKVYNDTGHSFRTVSQFVKLSHPYGFLANTDQQPTFQSSIEGPIVPYDSFGQLVGQFPDVQPLSDTEIAYYGKAAIAQTNPIRPDANLSDFLAQSILTKMPKLIGDLDYFRTKTGFLREAGSQYLNLEFGWAPLVSDLKGMLNVVLNSYNEIKKYHAGSGRITRRHFAFGDKDTVVSNGESVGGQIASSVNLPEIFGNRTYGTVKQIVTRKEHIYFKGAYTYYLPLENNKHDSLVDRFKRHADLAQHLLGLKLTPQVLWDLAPWTWLADWKFDITSTLEIQSDFSTDNLVLLYGYLMRTTRIDNTYSISDLNPNVGTRGPYYITYSVVQKERVQATPYGFGVNPEDFSLRQLAVLAALGITRAIRP